MVKKGIFYILLIYFNHAVSQDIFSFKYDTSVLNKDISILKHALLSNHPSIEFYGGYHFFYQYFDTALRIHQPLTEKEFRKFLKSKLNILRCGHTNILPSNKYIRLLNKKAFKVIPYFITYDNHNLVVVKSFEKEDTLLKSYDTILQIDKINSQDIIKEMKKYLYTDGYADIPKEEMIQRHFTFYFSGLYEKDSFLITIKNQQGIKDIIIKTREYMKVRNELMEMKTDTLFKHHKKSYFAGMYLDNKKNIYYMKIRVFGGIWMKRRFKRAFKDLNKNQSQYLIIDLRNNPGGKITQSIDLLSYLLPHSDSLIFQKFLYKIEERKYIRRKSEYRIIDFFIRLKGKKMDNSNVYIEKIPSRKKHHFKGKVYVIVNANTFSAANLVAVYLSKRANTKIVGSAPSGVKWGSQAVSFLRLYLPHTKIKVLIPTYRIIHNIKYHTLDDALLPIKPDIYTHYNTKDLLLKKDKETEAIYNDLIKNK